MRPFSSRLKLAESSNLRLEMVEELRTATVTPQVTTSTSQRRKLSLPSILFTICAAVNFQNFLSNNGCNAFRVSPMDAQIVSTPWSPHLLRGSCENLRIQAMNRRACNASSCVGNRVSRKCTVMGLGFRV